MVIFAENPVYITMVAYNSNFGLDLHDYNAIKVCYMWSSAKMLSCKDD